MPKYTVDWTSKADRVYHSIILEIINEWGVDAASKFRKKVNSLISGLENNKHLCPKSQIGKLRKCVISKQTSLIYEVKGNSITILTLIPNRTQHKY